MYRAIAANKRNTVFTILLFVVIIGALGALAGWLYGSWSITVMVLVIAIVYAVIQYFAASGEMLALSRARQITDVSQAPNLWNLLENLCITEGIPMPKLYVIDDPAMNAFATGRDPKRASIAVTTGLLQAMDKAELEGVLAHELGHVKNYDIRLNMIVFGLVVAIGMIADIMLRLALFGGRGRNNNAGPLLLVFGLVAAIIAPLVAALVQAAVSRQREYLADATGAMTTRYPEGLARALEKIGGGTSQTRTQNSSMAHAWFANPLRDGGLNRLFATHPPIEARINRLREIGSGATF